MDLLELVKHFEGFHRRVVSRDTVSAVPYVCPAGYWTIGYGHLCEEDHPPVTEEQATEYLDADLDVARNAVARYIKVALSPEQEDALVSWTFNLGAGRLRGSTLRKVINRGELSEAPNQMRRWVYGGGVKLPGLVLRREAEAALWEAGSVSVVEQTPASSTRAGPSWLQQALRRLRR